MNMILSSGRTGWGRGVALAAVLSASFFINLNAQDGPPVPDGGPGREVKPETPEEREKRLAALEAQRNANLERFKPYLIKSFDQLAGRPEDSQEFLSVDEFMHRQRVKKTREEVRQLTAQQEQKVLAERRSYDVPITPGNGVTFDGIDESGAARFVVSHTHNAAKTIQTQTLWPGGSVDADVTGNGQTVGMWDTQHPQTIHEAFDTGSGSRVTIKDVLIQGDDPFAYHSTRVAGILSAKFSGSGPGINAKGMAYESTVHAYHFRGDANEVGLAYDTNEVRITSHTYGRFLGWGKAVVNNNLEWVWNGLTSINQNEDYNFGLYRDVTAGIDAAAYSRPNLLPVWAASNDRDEAPPSQPTNHYVISTGSAILYTNVTRSADGDEGGYDSLSPEATSKNAMVVGSVADLPSGYQGTNSVIISSFSSSGPTDDGRIKPDVVANGEEVYAPVFIPGQSGVTNYNSESGTSFSSPSAAGTVVLLRQHFLNTHTNKTYVQGATMKAVVINTADDIGAPGPDFKGGYGLMNARAAGDLISSNALFGAEQNIREFVLQSQTFVEWPVWVNSTNQPVKTTIAWADPAASPAPFAVDPTNHILVNDLDLRVIDPAGGVHMPWVLDPDISGKTAAVRSQPATRGDDSLNNVEQVFFWPTNTGIFTIQITHKGTNLFGAGMTNIGYQNVSAVVSGNVAQPQEEDLQFLDVAMVSSNKVALMYNSEPGVTYQLQYKNDLNSTNWSNGPFIGSLQVIHAYVHTISGTPPDKRFYRLKK